MGVEGRQMVGVERLVRPAGARRLWADAVTKAASTGTAWCG
jgi:hypothetical protein